MGAVAPLLVMVVEAALVAVAAVAAKVRPRRGLAVEAAMALSLFGRGEMT